MPLTLPYTIANGQAIDATPVMANFNALAAVAAAAGAVAAASGANADITSLTALTTQLPLNAVAGTLIAIQYLTASGTLTTNAATKSVIIEGVGGGGGSGGSSTATTNQGSAGSGGVSGTWGRKRLTSGFSGTSYVIGAAGTAGAAAGAGGTGGSTTFGAVLTLPGGSGGVFGGAGSGSVASLLTLVPTQAAAATGADISIRGQPAPGPGVVLNTSQAYSAGGGSNPLGVGGPSALAIGSPSTGAPVAGTGFGSGAGGPVNIASAGQVGLAGQPGVLIVYEYS